MKIKSIAACLAAVALASAPVLTSCGNDSGSDEDYDYGVHHDYPDYFLLVTDAEGGNGRLVADATFAVDINYGTYTATLSLSRVPLADGSCVSAVFSDLPFSITAQTSILVEVSQAVSGSLAVSNLRLELKTRKTGEGEDAVKTQVATLSYNCQGQSVTAIAPGYRYYGLTETTLADGSVYTAPSTIPITLTFDPATSTASLTLVGPRFQDTPSMPDVTMTFPAIDASFTHSGFTLSAATIIPEAGGRPFPAFEITNLRGVGNYTGAMPVLTFDVKDRGSVKVTMTPA